MFSIVKRNAALLLIAGLVVGGGAVAWAEGSPSRPTVGAQAGASAEVRPGRAGHPGAALLRRAVHGDLIVRGKNGFENVTFDRGRLESRDGSTLTLKRPDGATVTLTVTDATKYRGVSGLDQLQTGRPTAVVSQDGKAVVVVQRAGARGLVAKNPE
jgi:hypothetical protein